MRVALVAAVLLLSSGTVEGQWLKYPTAGIPRLPDQLHFNPRAFMMAQPLSATVGNCGDVPLGIFRNPGFIRSLTEQEKKLRDIPV